MRDVVVVVLDLAKRFLVLLHQLIDVVILPFFDFENLHLRRRKWRPKFDYGALNMRDVRPSTAHGIAHLPT